MCGSYLAKLRGQQQNTPFPSPPCAGCRMVFEHIEALKRSWTDKFVVVDDSRPELRRFQGLTGTVRTVNMSGRALVEFDGNANIGWYDIDPGFLRVIDAPLPKPEAKKAEPKKAEAKPAAPAKPAAAAKPAAKPAPAKGGSAADILAAARANKPAAKTESAPAASSAGSSAAAPAAAKPAATKPAAAAPGKMSMEEILAAARGNKPAGAAPSKPAAKPAAAPPKPAAAPAAPEPEPEPEPVAEAAAPSAAGGRSKQHAFKTVAEMVAYCRQVDGK